MPNTRGQTSERKKTRKPHAKSRYGCFECKRRRVKCDEGRPACTRCTSLLEKCSYPPVPQIIQHQHGSQVVSPSQSPTSTQSISPSSSSRSEYSPAKEDNYFSLDNPIIILDDSFTYEETAEEVFDAYLYNHYIRHTSRTLSPCHGDKDALQTEMPKLAAQSKPVHHALLAVSAACICCDIISKIPDPQINDVTHALMAGYRHFNKASEYIRQAISQPGSISPEPLLASAILLVPFATSSQQINHWISTKSAMGNFQKLLKTTPRDAVIIMRAIRSTLQSMHYGSQMMEMELSKETIKTPTFISHDMLAPSRTHVIGPILASTSPAAFSELQNRLDSTIVNHGSDPDGLLLACNDSLKLLKYIARTTFSPPSHSDTPNEDNFHPQPVPVREIAPWLLRFANRARNPSPTEPLTAFFFSFLVQAPQAYLDLVLPLLDQRLEQPVDSMLYNMSVELTETQALALDIYAHWSVLMFLVEKDSWWIGNLPVVTLTSMVNTYGDDFVGKIWPGNERWWPVSMLNILKEIKRHE